MKVSLIILFVGMASVSYTQNEESLLRQQTDSIVKRLDTLEGKSERFRWMLGYYEYKTVDNVIVKIYHRYKSGPAKIEKTFYADKNGLIYSTEKKITFYGPDSIGWAGQYYFEQKKLKYYQTLGHGKSETEEWKPEKEVPEDYQKAIDLISRHKQKPGSKKNK